jgi:hypothetical protein
MIFFWKNWIKYDLLFKKANNVASKKRFLLAFEQTIRVYKFWTLTCGKNSDVVNIHVTKLTIIGTCYIYSLLYSNKQIYMSQL